MNMHISSKLSIHISRIGNHMVRETIILKQFRPDKEKKIATFTSFPVCVFVAYYDCTV